MFYFFALFRKVNYVFKKKILMLGGLILPPLLLWSCDQNVSPLTIIKHQEETQSLKLFNNTVKIMPAERYITQDANNNDLAAMTYLLHLTHHWFHMVNKLLLKRCPSIIFLKTTDR